MAVSVVTGANSGIGRATPVHLGDKLATLAAGVEVRPVQFDVRDDDHARRFRDAFGLELPTGGLA